MRLCESDLTVDATREIYERAVAVVPPAPEKRLWRRYIYLWIYYAIFEELVAEVCSVPSLSIFFILSAFFCFNLATLRHVVGPFSNATSVPGLPPHHPTQTGERICYLN